MFEIGWIPFAWFGSLQAVQMVMTPYHWIYSFRHFNKVSQTGVRKWCTSNLFLFIVFVMIIGLAISLIVFLLWMLCLHTLDLRSLSFRGTITWLSLCQIQLCTVVFSGWILLILAKLLQTCISSFWEFVYSVSETAFVKITQFCSRSQVLWERKEACSHGNLTDSSKSPSFRIWFDCWCLSSSF